MPFSAQHIKTARLHLQKSDPTMKKIIKQVGPFTGKTTRNRFAALVKSIVSQQISTSAARTILGRLHAAVVENPGPTFSVVPEDFSGLDGCRGKKRITFSISLTKSTTKRSI
jgi:DNA-3-methyladenine glycosylase II